MLKIASAGVAVLVSGALQLAHSLDRPLALAEYLAFRCGSEDSAFGPGTIGHAVLAAGHCWGCFAVATGAGLVVFAAWRALRPAHQNARHPR